MAKTKKNPLVRAFIGFQRGGLETISRFYSQYRAIVYKRDDPEGLNRLILIIPEITDGDYLPIWAWPKGNFAGKGYGMQVMPRVGDIVWVEFERGDPSAPVWSHGYFAEGEKPNDEDTLDLDCYWLITPGGHKIKLNDTSGAIKIERKGGGSIEMNDNSVSINTDKPIIHGNLDTAKYSHVLGEELIKCLNDITNAVNLISSNLQKDVVASAASTFLTYTNTASGITSATTKIKSAINQVQKILSSQTKLEK